MVRGASSITNVPDTMPNCGLHVFPDTPRRGFWHLGRLPRNFMCGMTPPDHLGWALPVQSLEEAPKGVIWAEG